MTLPIEAIPGTRPQQFTWQQRIGGTAIPHKGRMMPTVEVALLELILLAKQQRKHIEELYLTVAELEKQLVEAQIPVATPAPNEPPMTAAQQSPAVQQAKKGRRPT